MSKTKFGIVVFPAPLGQSEAPSPEIAVFAEGSEDVVGAVYEKGAQEAVSGLGDAKLLLAASGLILSGTQTEIGTDRTASFEALWILDHEGEGQRCDGTHPTHFDKSPGLGGCSSSLTCRSSFTT